MKTIKNKIPKIITALTVILWIPLAASAADMWDETPGLDNNVHGQKPQITESTLLAKEK